MSEARDQLSLYIGGPDADALNAWRAVLDPVQAGLIPAHVTVCREDELADLLSLGTAGLAARLRGCTSLTLQFGAAQRLGGHGLILPCTAGQQQLDDLRRRLLGRADIRAQPAHITLAHPRNPRAPGNPDPIAPEPPARLLVLSDLRWIHQTAGGPWQTLARFSLGPVPR